MKKALVLDNLSEVPQYEGTVQIAGSLQGNGVRCAVVVSRFNMELTTALADAAVRSLLNHGVKASDINVAWVPGAYEIPTVVNELSYRPRSFGRFPFPTTDKCGCLTSIAFPERR